MKRKYVAFGLTAFAVSLGWNVFLIRRDDALHKAYYRNQGIENLKRPPSSEIGYNPKEKFCQQQAGWHPDCNVE